MPRHTETRVLPYTPDEVFALVADVERYPEFLPWCLAARVTRREEGTLWADMTVGYRLIRERFSSKVALEPPHAVRVEYLGGPLRHLSNRWAFAPAPGGGCTVEFCIDFAFANPLLQRLAGAFFAQAFTRMVRAFEARARALYGPRAA
ncbi:MAG TPA: ubiquinone-binding protein [Rhodospirillaceae bacterium]|jgi:coenzyme Q-binding protein COQ10|nr:type II toxin-antitoxin system RatA family toxin [Alphaproteobacteria bacterium]HBH26711.1 ubiquinone-binding protein [Rhodospirillaceae bacterium]